MPTLGLFEFTIVLAGVSEVSDNVENQVLAAGCDDAFLSSCNGEVTLDFHREAASLEEAVLSAVRDLRAVGYDVARTKKRGGRDA